MQADAFGERMSKLRMPVTFLPGDAFQSFVTSEFERNAVLLDKAGLKKN